jgi:hypothetical protein
MNPQTTGHLVRTILALQARVDAQAHVLAALWQQSGNDIESMNRMLQVAMEHAYQFRLERIEDQSPGLSAKLDQHRELSSIDLDQEILDQLRWDDGYRPEAGQ